MSYKDYSKQIRIKEEKLAKIKKLANKNDTSSAKTLDEILDEYFTPKLFKKK